MTTGKQRDEVTKRGGCRRVVLRLSVMLAATLVGLLMCEVVLRVAGYTYPVFYAPDEELGYALRPGVQGWYRKEGAAYVRVNSEGLRDREHAREKPPGVVRVAVVGDSYAEALQVEQEAAFWSVLERALGGCDAFRGRKVEVINFGVSGYGTAQELLTLRKKVWAYAPDVVLLAVTTNNDITDNSRALKRTDEVPYFVLRDGRLVLDDSFRTERAFVLRQSLPSRAGRWIREHLRVIQAIHQGHGAIKSAIAKWRSRRSTPAAALALTTSTNDAAKTSEQGSAPQTIVGEEAGADNLVYREPTGEVWHDAWSVTERLLVEMRGEVEQRGARFFVVTLSNAIQVHPEPAAREQFMRRLGVETLLYPDRRIKALGEREGFAVFNLAPELQLYAEQHKVFLHGFAPDLGNGHWNQTGHRVAGEIIARELCKSTPR